MAKSIEYGMKMPKSDFDKRANDCNVPPASKKNTSKGSDGGHAKQTKGFGASRK